MNLIRGLSIVGDAVYLALTFCVFLFAVYMFVRTKKAELCLFALLFSFNICMLSFFNSTVYSPFSDSFFTGLLLSRNVTGFSCFRVFITMQG